MAKFTARTTAPSTTDKNWLHTSAGGFNSCIHISGGSVLPNCVGYAWGRARELMGKDPALSRANAENWYGHNDGYERGQTPRLGAIICWRRGKAGVSSDGAGHVAVVEKINPDGSILVSNSDYGGRRFYTKTYKAPNYPINSAYAFQGFIYLPVTFEDETPKKSVEQIADEVIAGQWGNGQERVDRLTAAGYDAQAVQDAVNARYAQKTPTQTEAIKEGDKVMVEKNAPVYGKNIRFDAWVYNAVLYVREIVGDRAVVSTQQTGVTTGAVDKKYLRKV